MGEKKDRNVRRREFFCRSGKDVWKPIRNIFQHTFVLRISHESKANSRVQDKRVGGKRTYLLEDDYACMRVCLNVLLYLFHPSLSVPLDISRCLPYLNIARAAGRVTRALLTICRRSVTRSRVATGVTRATTAASARMRTAVSSRRAARQILPMSRDPEGARSTTTWSCLRRS